MNEITCCILVKNEEKNISDCILSAKKLTKNIIIIDNGSTDKTKELAKEFDVKIYSQPNGSESELRNMFFKYSLTKWIFSLDADERIDDLLVKEIAEAVQKSEPNIEAYRMPVNNYFGGGRWSTNLVCRLFMNKTYIRFDDYELHTSLGDSILKAHKNIGKLNHPIHHLDALQKTRNKNKRKKYVEKLEKYRDVEKSSRVLNYLAVEKISQGMYEEAEKLLAEIISLKNKDSFLASVFMGECLIQKGEFDRAKEIFDRLIDIDEESMLKELNMGMEYLQDAMIISNDIKQRCYSKQAEISLINDDKEAAIHYIDQAINIAPYASQHYLNKASLLYQNNDMKEQFNYLILTALKNNSFLPNLFNYPIENKESQYYHQSIVLSTVTTMIQNSKLG